MFSMGCMHGYMLPRMQRDGEFGQPNLENHLANDGFRDVCIAPHTAVLRSAKLRNSGSLAPRPPSAAVCRCSLRSRLVVVRTQFLGLAANPRMTESAPSRTSDSPAPTQS